MRPSPIEVDEFFSNLRALFKPGQDKRVPLDTFENSLRAALKRDQAGSVRPDSFPTGGDGGGSTDVSRPTENAVVGTYKPLDRNDPFGPHVQRLPKDPVHEDTENAWAWAQEMMRSYRAAQHRLNHLESLTGKPQEPEMCNSCLQVGVCTPMEHFGDVAGKLPRPWRLCAPCYDWIRKHDGGPPPVAYLERRHGVGMKGRTRVANSGRMAS